MENKAQIGGLQAIILALVVIGILLGVGFLLLQEFQESIDDETATVQLETLPAVITDTGVYPSRNSTDADTFCFNTFAIINITNTSNGILVTTDNYTYDTATAKITNLTEDYSTELVNVSYTYNYGKDSCGGIETTVKAVQVIPTWLIIIVILAIVGILLAIVFKILPTGEGGGISGMFKGGGGGTIAEI